MTVRPRAPVPGEEPRHCLACGGSLDLQSLKEGEPDRHVCQACGRIHYLDPKVAACVVPQKDGRILLLQRSIDPGKGKWVIPGGFVDRGERPEAAAVRETREEVGLEVRLTELIGVYGGETGPIVIVYLGEVTGGEASARDEALAVRWVAPDEIPWDELAFSSTADSLRDLGRRQGWYPEPRPAATG